MRIRIYTDGACSGNPGIGGWASIILFPEGKQEISGHESHTTNNRMELMAAVQGILLSINLGYKKIDLYSDSAYLVNAINKSWLEKWKLNGWKTVHWQDVKNKDLWVKLLKLLAKCELNIVKVKGHSGDKYNEQVDVLAKKEIERFKLSS